jgi:hypothetical protein
MHASRDIHIVLSGHWRELCSPDGRGKSDVAEEVFSCKPMRRSPTVSHLRTGGSSNTRKGVSYAEAQCRNPSHRHDRRKVPRLQAVWRCTSCLSHSRRKPSRSRRSTRRLSGTLSCRVQVACRWVGWKRAICGTPRSGDQTRRAYRWFHACAAEAAPTSSRCGAPAFRMRPQDCQAMQKW